MILIPNNDQAAKLSLEIWESLSGYEIDLRNKGVPHQNLVLHYSNVIIPILISGLISFDSSTEDGSIDDAGEITVPLSVGIALESISKNIGNAVLQPVLDNIIPLLQNPDWGKRWAGMIGLGSIIEGPEPLLINNALNTSFKWLVQMFSDPVPMVRQAVGYVLYKLMEFVPDLLFQSPDNLDPLFNECLNHLGNQEPILIINLVLGTLMNVFNQFQKR